MRHNVVGFAIGTLLANVLTSWLSVYVFHDVDRGMEARLDEAFQGLGIEGLFFTAFTAFLFLISARIWFAISKSPPAPHLLLSFYLGVGLIGVQYSISIATRYLLADTLWFESSLQILPPGAPYLVTDENYKPKNCPPK